MEVKYKSTRGGISGISFEAAVLSGFAPDGGLFLPESLPRFSRDEFKSWATFTYPQLIEKFMRYFLSNSEADDHEISGKFVCQKMRKVSL